MCIRDSRRDVGLFRYSLIREPADRSLSKAERGVLVRSLAARDHVGPDGTRVRVSRTTLDRWIRLWRTGGFDALVPSGRQVAARGTGGGLGPAGGAEGAHPERSAGPGVGGTGGPPTHDGTHSGGG